MNWTHEILSCMVALFLGVCLGAMAGKNMPSWKLSWTCTPMAVALSLVLPVSVGAPIWVEVFATACSFAAMITYAFSEVAGHRKRGEHLYTPIDALRRRWGRAVATVCVILPVIHRLTVAGVLVGIAILAVMWGYGERNALRALLLSKAIPVIARYDADLARRMESAALGLVRRLERK